MRSSLWFFFSFILVMQAFASDNGPEKFLPPRAGKWKPVEPDRYFHPDNLFDYINGGAELYLSYGFREVLSRRYECPGNPCIQVEIFDMIEPANAFGIYTQTREEEGNEYGQGSQVLPGAVLFWKGPFYISVISEYETPASEEMIRWLAAYIDSRISSTGEIPAVVRALPRDGLDEGSVVYFRHYVWANRYYYIADGNVFGIENDTQCCLGRYTSPQGSYYVLLMDFPSGERVDVAWQGYWEERGGEPSPLTEQEGDRWHAGHREGSRMAMVFRAPDRDTALKTIAELFASE
ncbi:MAG: DUF6599 family protein [Bacteroidales bacterium]